MTATSVCGGEGEVPPRDTYILDHGFQFNPATWQRWLPAGIDLPDWLRVCSPAAGWPCVTRRDLLNAGANAQSGHDAMGILIGAYVWGSGLPAGRGPVRLRRILGLNEDHTASRLGKALRVLRTEGSLAAYATFRPRGEYRLRGLGASFYTKLLYFLGWHSAAGDQRPLIMDQFVVIGLNRCRNTAWRPFGPWTTDQYGEYLTWAHEQATRWGARIEADVVERAVWEHGKR
ncbi:hypothetical protein [Micromonospora gifhornensis]|uniref:8-oxoguanine DNA glycosylase OGG fold protein n=1 Tax=Micromonospora gifhornensis TaxID=84594 RepID=UPI003D712B42